MFAAHGVHTLLPRLSLYVPASHSVHSCPGRPPPPPPVYPELQMQWCIELLPAGDEVSGGQAMQVELDICAVCVEYVLGGQGSQASEPLCGL